MTSSEYSFFFSFFSLSSPPQGRAVKMCHPDGDRARKNMTCPSVSKAVL